MGAQSAPDDYVQSRPSRVLFRSEAEVIALPNTRSGAQVSPEQNHHKTPQTQTSDSGWGSGTGITASDIPGDWASVRAVWDGSPEPLSALVAKVTGARDPDHRSSADVAMACWAVLVLLPRGLLHLASWALDHPVRSLAAAVLLVVLFASF